MAGRKPALPGAVPLVKPIVVDDPKVQRALDVLFAAVQELQSHGLVEPEEGITLPIDESDVTDLVADLAGKAPISHTHAITDLSGGSEGEIIKIVGGVKTWTTASGSVPVPEYSSGTDGALHFDGSVVTLGNGTTITPSGSTYTLPRDLFPTNCTIDAGVTVVGAGYGIFCTGTATINGDFINNGANGASLAPGAGAAGSGRFAAGANGGAGNSSGGSTSNVPVSLSSNATAAGGSPNGAAGSVAFAGGGGGGLYSSGASGGSVTVMAATSQGSPTLPNLIAGRSSSNTQFGTGSGGGGADGSSPANRGTGGGGGGGIALTCQTLAGSGTIQAKGGNGSDGGTAGGFGGGGGGGGGGLAIVEYGTKTGTVTVNVSGGNGGAKSANDGGFVAGTGGAGHAGVAVVVNISGDGT